MEVEEVEEVEEAAARGAWETARPRRADGAPTQTTAVGCDQETPWRWAPRDRDGERGDAGRAGARRAHAERRRPRVIAAREAHANRDAGGRGGVRREGCRERGSGRPGGGGGRREGTDAESDASDKAGTPNARPRSAPRGARARGWQTHQGANGDAGHRSSSARVCESRGVAPTSSPPFARVGDGEEEIRRRGEECHFDDDVSRSALEQIKFRSARDHTHARSTRLRRDGLRLSSAASRWARHSPARARSVRGAGVHPDAARSRRPPPPPPPRGSPRDETRSRGVVSLAPASTSDASGDASDVAALVRAKIAENKVTVWSKRTARSARASGSLRDGRRGVRRRARRRTRGDRDALAG